MYLHTYHHSNDLVDELSARIIANLTQAIEHQGKAVLLVSGGSTPIPLFKKLSQAQIEWEKVCIGLCDERWVDPSHEDSNERLVKTHLMQGYATAAQFVGMYQSDKDVMQASQGCDGIVESLLWPCDVAILGMGEDGHTASLFPHNKALVNGCDFNYKKRCIAVIPQAAAHPRMSLTLFALLSVKHLYLHFEGVKKRCVFDEAMKDEDCEVLPVRCILHQEINPVEVYYA